MSNEIIVSVVIPVFNQVHFTTKCLDSLLKNSSLRPEVFVIDNASSDETFRVLANYQLLFAEAKIPFTVITNKVNVGFGRAMNQGARLAKGKYIALLNNDTWLMPQWDKALVQSIDHLEADMISPYFYEGDFKEGEMESLAASTIKRNQGKKSKNWGSVLMFFNLASFREIGMFDEDYFVTFEDNDLRERCDRKGYKYYIVGDCFIWHFGKGTRNQDNKPSRLEQEGLAIFIKKWGFNPQIKENTFWKKQLRSFRKWKKKRGLL